MKVKPESALKACRFQFLKMKGNNDVLCDLINHIDVELQLVKNNVGFGGPANLQAAMDRLQNLEMHITQSKGKLK